MGVDWATWRLATSERLNASLSEIENQWSIADVLSANMLLDSIEAALAPKPKDR